MILNNKIYSQTWTSVPSSAAAIIKMTFALSLNEAPDLLNVLMWHLWALFWFKLTGVSMEEPCLHIHNSHQWRCQIANIRQNFNFLCCGKLQLVFSCWRINTVSQKEKLDHRVVEICIYQSQVTKSLFTCFQFLCKLEKWSNQNSKSGKDIILKPYW